MMVGQIFFLNYDYASGKGFFSKLTATIAHANRTSGDQYNLIKTERFDETFKGAIDDAFYYITNSISTGTVNHSKFGEIDLNACYFAIDVVDPPATPVPSYSGDSVGVAVLLALFSAFFEIPIYEDIAVTGCFRSRLSPEIGFVGNIKGKINTILSANHASVKRFIIPNLNQLYKEEVINSDEISGLIGEIITINETKTVVTECQSVGEFIKATLRNAIIEYKYENLDSYSAEFPEEIEAMRKTYTRDGVRSGSVWSSSILCQIESSFEIITQRKFSGIDFHREYYTQNEKRLRIFFDNVYSKENNISQREYGKFREFIDRRTINSLIYRKMQNQEVIRAKLKIYNAFWKDKPYFDYYDIEKEAVGKEILKTKTNEKDVLLIPKGYNFA